MPLPRGDILDIPIVLLCRPLDGLRTHCAIVKQGSDQDILGLSSYSYGEHRAVSTIAGRIMSEYGSTKSRWMHRVILCS